MLRLPCRVLRETAWPTPAARVGRSEDADGRFATPAARQMTARRFFADM